MKLINLNTWGGVVYEPLVEFIKKYSIDTDVFCFQEVFHNATKIDPLLNTETRPKLFSELQDILSGFNGYHFPTYEGDHGGLAVFIKKSFVVDKVDNLVIFSETNTITDRNSEDFFAMGRNLQRIKLNYFGKECTVFNFHGMWVFKGKIDTKKRIEQSEKIKEIFDESKGARILCGDFNLDPETKSIEMLSDGNQNLIREYKITSTRSSLYKKPTKFADYVIVSPEVEVVDFKALQDKVSDHLPLLLEFK